MRRRAALLLLALAAAVPVPDGYRMSDYNAPVPDTVPGGTVIHAPELAALLARGGVVLVDVMPAPRRPAEQKPGTPWMPLPRMDLPGSVWLPDVGRGALSPAMAEWFRARLAALTRGDKSTPVVFYCNPECWMSWNATRRAAAEGYRNLYWYPDGPAGWQAVGHHLAPAKPEPTPG